MKTVQQLAQILDKEPEQVTKTAHQVLLNLVLTAETHDFSKKGFVEELEAGIKPEYINDVCGEGREWKDLDIEVMAEAGKKRLEMKNLGSELPEEMTDYPLRIVEGELGERIK